MACNKGANLALQLLDLVLQAPNFCLRRVLLGLNGCELLLQLPVSSARAGCLTLPEFF
jgi:hypothetical protein